MQKITQEQIKFIDNYLQKSDVIFVDIRTELTDHIASAVEEKMEVENVDFYDAFKDFMAKNKKEVLRERNNYLASLNGFLRTLYKPYNILIAISTAICFCFLPESVYPSINILIFISIISFCLIQTTNSLITKKRFAYLEQVTFSLTVIYFTTLFFNGFYKNFEGNKYSLGIVSFLLIAFFVHYVLTLKKFKKKYAFL